MCIGTKAQQREEFIAFFSDANIITCCRHNMEETINSCRSKLDSHELDTVGCGSDNDSEVSFHDDDAGVRSKSVPGNVSDGELSKESKGVFGCISDGESRGGSDNRFEGGSGRDSSGGAAASVGGVGRCPSDGAGHGSGDVPGRGSGRCSLGSSAHDSGHRSRCTIATGVFSRAVAYKPVSNWFMVTRAKKK